MESPRTDLLNREIDSFKELISKHVSEDKSQEISDLLMENYITITPPMEEVMTYLITLSSVGGRGGGNSVKPGNIILNWKKLLVDSADSLLTGAGAVAFNALIPFAALVIWNKLVKHNKIRVEEPHAIVISALWQIKDPYSKQVLGEDLLDRINTTIAQYNLQPFIQSDIDSILNDLEALSSLRRNSDGSLTLLEEVRVRYR